MNWIKRKIIAWAMNECKRLEEPTQLSSTTSAGRMGDVFYGCEQLRFTILNVSNGTLVRMDTHHPEDEYTVRQGGPRRPPVFIVKDDETVQDVIVRQLGIAALERV